jgi:hypothetical protein
MTVNLPWSAYTHPCLLPKIPNNTAALLKAGTDSGHGSVEGWGTCEARFRRACRDSSVKGARSRGVSNCSGSGRRDELDIEERKWWNCETAKRVRDRWRRLSGEKSRKEGRKERGGRTGPTRQSV